MKLRATAGNCILEKVIEEVSKGGILLPNADKQQTKICTVVHVGPPGTRENGTEIPVQIKKGDRVVCRFYNYDANLEKRFVVVPQSDIVAIVEGE